MKKINYLKNYFSKTEIALWSFSVLLTMISFIIVKNKNYMTFLASLIGITSLILNAKGNFVGHILMIIFSILYGLISYSFAYYGEMITYLGMTAPMAMISLISWLKNPYGGSRLEVEIKKLRLKEIILLPVLTVAVTFVFYYILKFFHTANLALSTFSVATSFAAVYLTARRSAFYALFYALNDAVLIILWLPATLSDSSYISVIICFIAFLINDIYGFMNWQSLHKKQSANQTC